MVIETSRFGKIEFDKSEIISMVTGLLGFDEYVQFVLVSLKGQEPFKWLQSLDDPSLAFLMIDPLFFKPNYIVEINPKDLFILKTDNINDVAIFVLVSIPPGRPELMSANLLAPLAINKTNMKAIQLVLNDSKYATDRSIFSELEQRLAETSVQENN